MARCMGDLGVLEFSPAGEEWIEYGPPEARRRIGFHDYAAIYADALHGRGGPTRSAVS